MAPVLRAADVLARNNVRVRGHEAGRPLVFVHGFACDQRMWRHIAPAFEAGHRVVLLDQVGGGASDVTAYDAVRHSRLEGYAEDLVEVAEALDLRDAVLVGHSVGAAAGILAHLMAPGRFAALALVNASARYVDEPETGYLGGLTEADAAELLATIEANFAGWAEAMAPSIMNAPDRPELGAELEDAFCGTDPDIAARWARVSFLTDVRDVLASVEAPVLLLQCTDDPIVPEAAGRWMAARLPDGRFVQLDATGHCPHLSAPAETTAALRAFLQDLDAA
jgi:sigma-B regulation protein RsbQ